MTHNESTSWKPFLTLLYDDFFASDQLFDLSFSASLPPPPSSCHPHTLFENRKKTEDGNVGTSSDIYAFGICALETAALDITPTVSTNSTVGQGDKAKETTPAPQAAEDPTPLGTAASASMITTGGEGSASAPVMGKEMKGN